MNSAMLASSASGVYERPVAPQVWAISVLHVDTRRALAGVLAAVIGYPCCG